MITKNAKYRVKNNQGEYEIVHFETNADLVITNNNRQFITQEELEMIYRNAPQHYVHNQISASQVWLIQHNLGKMPSVSISDSAGTIVYGEIKYLDLNNIEVRFSSGFSGKAILN